MLLAQLSDLHACPPGARFKDRVDTNAALTAAVAALKRAKPLPDAVLVTGDLTEDGDAASYGVVREALSALPMPSFVMPGNHDDRETLRAAFPDADYLPRDGPFLSFSTDLQTIRLIALDTVVPGEAGGALCDQRLAWLERELDAAKGRPVVIAMHHPPFDCGIGHMDQMGCRGHEALRALLEPHPNVERIICGHVHRMVQARFGPTTAIICPGTAHQVTLDLTAGAPACFDLEPGAFLLHKWQEDVGLVTHQAYVDRWPGPYGF